MTSTSSSPSWQQICAKVKAHRDSTIASVYSQLPPIPTGLPLNVTYIPALILTPPEYAITSLPITTLLHYLSTRTISSTTVINAYLRCAALAQELTNCLTELLPSRALTRAQWLDNYIAEHGKPVGPLHGLPISAKEHICMEGLECNAGFVSWVGRKSMDDALVLKILWDAGAVFYARTTEPQTIMHLETSSNLYGVTVNPYNRLLTAGGSSGGEGALLGLRGSCLGIGTDIGGSIRSPAANNGLFGLRPTALRIPVTGMGHAIGGCEQLLGTLGPLSTSICGIKIFMKTVIDAEPWLIEPSLVPIPWREHDLIGSSGEMGRTQKMDQQGKRKIKIAIMWGDGVVRPHPPVRRVLAETVERMRKCPQIEVVDWQPHRFKDAWEILSHLYFPDGGASEAKEIDVFGEPWRPLSAWVIKDNPYVSHLSIEKVWKWTEEREKFRAEYAQLWSESGKLSKKVFGKAELKAGRDAVVVGEGVVMVDSDTSTKNEEYCERFSNQAHERDGYDTSDDEEESPIDAILCPVAPGAAPPFECARYWGYTSLWNLVDWPALVFPVSVVDQERDSKEVDYTPTCEEDEYNHELYIGPERYADAPIGLQLVCRRFEDEKVVGVYEYLNGLGVFGV